MKKTKAKKKPASTHKDVGGRPSDYKKEYATIAENALALNPMTNYQLAQLFGINIKTLYRWFKSNPELKRSIQAGRDFFNNQVVEQCFMQRCAGYTYEETKVEQITITGPKDSEGKKTKVPAQKVTVTTKTVLPNVSALIFYMCNRLPERWQQITKMEFSGEVETTEITSTDQLNRDELKNLTTLLQKASGMQAKKAADAQDEMLKRGRS